jgi:hypothetical protein
MIQSSLSRSVALAAIRTRGVKAMTTATAKRASAATLDVTPSSTSSHHKVEAKFPWCKTALVQGGDVSIETIAGPDHGQPLESIRDRVFDLTQSPEWMEYLEHKENRLEDEGGAGAYDVLRCDVVLSPLEESSNRLRIWGEDYHLKRLKQSYKALLKAKSATASPDVSVDAKNNKVVLDEAMEQSRATLRALLAETELASQTQTESTTSSEADTYIHLYRVTLLWSPPAAAQSLGENSGKILVRGHASSSCKPMKVHGSPEPIVVSVAAHTEAGESEKATIDRTLPTRHTSPHSKIASWCRLRKTIENSKTYHPSGVSEVLMVRPRQDEAAKSRLEVLEGLSSNFFVIYKDGTLRTATEGVLNGYVRHLVFECASKCGLKFDPRPIFLHQTSEWKEAFITSSSRLIYPISKILLPEDEQESTSHERSGLVECWRDQALAGDHLESSKTPKWQELLNEILKTGGYGDA